MSESESPPIIINFPDFTESGTSQRLRVIEKPTVQEDPLREQLSRLATACLRAKEEEIPKLGSKLIKVIVEEASDKIKNNPEGALEYLQRRFRQYREILCVPIAAARLEPREASDYSNFYFYLLEQNNNPDQEPELTPRLKEFKKKVIQSFEVRQKFEQFCRTVEASQEEFAQGVLGELIFFVLSKKSGLKPEFSSVGQDTKGHIDYFIYPEGKKVSIQVKSSKSPSEFEIRKLPDGRWLVLIGAPPLDLNNQSVVEYYTRMLFPTKELIEKFTQSFRSQAVKTEQYISSRLTVKAEA